MENEPFSLDLPLLLAVFAVVFSLAAVAFKASILWLIAAVAMFVSMFMVDTAEYTVFALFTVLIMLIAFGFQFKNQGA